MGDDAPSVAGARLTRVSVANAFVSTLLVVLTIFASCVAVTLLSCTLTQGRMSTLSIDGVTLSIWKLDAIRQDWSDTRNHIKELQSTLTMSQIKLSNVNVRKSVADEHFKTAKASLLSLLEQANFQIRPFDKPLADDMSGKGPTEQVGRLQAASEPLIKDHPELKGVLDQITTAHATYLTSNNDAATARFESEAVSGQINDIADQTKRGKQQLDTLFGSIKSNLDDAGRAKIENALFEITPIPGRIGTFMNRLVTAPPEVLALSLVIMMGVLGSLLQIVHSFFRQDVSEGFGIYFVRIAAGGVTALVIFIVAKSGIPIVADASRLGGDAPINPYFISFLAIVSGLLSEQAIASVQARGAQFFPSNPAIDVERWSRDDLTQRASSGSNTIAELAGFLGLDPKSTTDILNGSDKATGNQQKTIAAYLHGSIREIFTDIAPGDQAGSAEPSPADPSHKEAPTTDVRGQTAKDAKQDETTDAPATDAPKAPEGTPNNATATDAQKDVPAADHSNQPQTGDKTGEGGGQ